MGKAILLIRTSTLRQETDSQLNDVMDFAMSFGYKKNDLIVIGDAGASAIKLDDKYIANINKVYEHINKGGVDAVFAWAIDRIGRNEEVLMSFKNKLIENNVNLYIQKPYLVLLNNDGTVNKGIELAFSLFATMSKQEMEMKQDRFARARERDKKAGLFLGGTVRYGYDTIDRHFIIKQDEADVIRLMFNMYATGQYSFYTLSEELKKQGIEKEEYWVSTHLKFEGYWDGSMPQIVPVEVAEKCCKIREQNKTKMPRSVKHHYFANRLIHCNCCGYGYTTSQKTYRCAECKKGEQIAITNLDGLLWLIASHLEGEERLHNKDRQKAIKEKQAVLGRKIKAVDNYKAKAEKRLIRAKEAYLNGIIDLAEYKAKTQADESMIKDLENEKVSYQNELEQLKKPTESYLDRLLTIADELSETDEVEMKVLVRKWVKEVKLEEGVVSVTTLIRNYQCLYKSKSNIGRFFTLGGRRLVVQQVVRSVDGAKLGKAVGDVGDVVITTAWLSGSVIV